MSTAGITFSNFDDDLIILSTGAINVGDPIISTQGEIMGFATGSCTASGVFVTYRVRGRCNSVPKSTNDAWVRGQLLWWDSVNLVATRTPTLYPLGFAASTQLAADTTGDVVVMWSPGPIVYESGAVSATLTSWTTFTAFSTGTVTLPANFLTALSRLKIKGRVTWVGVNSTNTMQLIVKFAGTAIITSIARNPTAGDVASFDAEVKILTNGASGTWKSHGVSLDGAIGAAPATNLYAVGSTAIDTTSATANTVVVGAVCSVSNSGNQATLDELSVEINRA